MLSNGTVALYELGYYDDTPTIQPSTGIAYSEDLVGFTEVLGGGNAGSVKYQISPDDGATWWYNTGSGWIQATDGQDLFAETMTVSVLNDKISSFDTTTGRGGTFKWKAFLVSDGTQPVEIDSITVTEAEASGINSG